MDVDADVDDDDDPILSLNLANIQQTISSGYKSTPNYTYMVCRPTITWQMSIVWVILRSSIRVLFLRSSVGCCLPWQSILINCSKVRSVYIIAGNLAPTSLSLSSLSHSKATATVLVTIRSTVQWFLRFGVTLSFSLTNKYSFVLSV